MAQQRIGLCMCVWLRMCARGYTESIAYADSVSYTDSVRRSVPHATHHRDSAAWVCTSVWVMFAGLSCTAVANGVSRAREVR